MKKIIFSTLVALLLAFVGCQNEELVNDNNTDHGNGKKVTLTAHIQGSADSRVALTPATDDKGKPIVKVEWKESGEKFKVYGYNSLFPGYSGTPTWFYQKEGTNQFEGELPSTDNGTYLAVYGDDEESKNTPLQYFLNGQDGTLTDCLSIPIEDEMYHLHYVLMRGTIADLSLPIEFEHETAILKPTFKVGGTDIDNTITQIVMGNVIYPTTTIDGIGEITIIPTSPATTLAGDIYIHLPIIYIPDRKYSPNHKFTFTVTAGGKEYTGSLTIPEDMSIVAGNLYTATIDLTPYLTFSSSNVQTLSTVAYSGWPPSKVVVEIEDLEYSVGGGQWQALGNGKPEFGGTKGDLRLRGKCTNGTDGAMIDLSGSGVTCSGDIRTLIDYECYETISTVDAVFSSLFEGCTALTDASDLKLISNNNKMAAYCYYEMFAGCSNLTVAPELPATTLADYCYAYMFAECSNLTAAPKLPATTLATHCYSGMFSSCTNLAAAPELSATTLAVDCYKEMFAYCSNLTTAPTKLPATTLAANCYMWMFHSCTSLEIAPELPATTLAESCCWQMFYGCSSLTTAPTELPATILAADCYSGMFYECESLETAPVLPATALERNCYGGMFYQCESLETAPVLPATTLAADCYSGMFKGCTSLNSVTMLATDISANNCLKDWMSGVDTEGTFTKHKDMTSLLTGESGIPSGWDVVDYVAPGEGI